MNRNEHLAWAKARAIEYVDAGDLKGAMDSMLSDLGKHEELAYPAVLGQLAMTYVITGDAPAMRRWVKGFN